MSSLIGIDMLNKGLGGALINVGNKLPRRIYVGNIPYQTSGDALKHWFNRIMSGIFVV